MNMKKPLRIMYPTKLLADCKNQLLTHLVFYKQFPFGTVFYKLRVFRAIRCMLKAYNNKMKKFLGNFLKIYIHFRV